jgi:hypothetical protein
MIIGAGIFTTNGTGSRNEDLIRMSPPFHPKPRSRNVSGMVRFMATPPAIPARMVLACGGFVFARWLFGM